MQQDVKYGTFTVPRCRRPPHTYRSFDGDPQLIMEATDQLVTLDLNQMENYVKLSCHVRAPLGQFRNTAVEPIT
jgi:hypothetical protein